MRASFDDKCACCQSINTFREQTGQGWQIFCRDCGKGEVFIDFAEFESLLMQRIDKVEHSEAKRQALIHKWFTY